MEYGNSGSVMTRATAKKVCRDITKSGSAHNRVPRSTDSFLWVKSVKGVQVVRVRSRKLNK